MNHFLVIFKKEILEYIRTYKLFIMLVIFLIFGMTNPLVAKLTPELLANFMPEGIVITLPEPTSLDAWAQFFKNSQQMGFIVMVLVFSGILGTELSQGTLIIPLTKGLKRSAVIGGKYAAMLLVWTVGIVSSFFLTWIYTVYLFPDDNTVQLLFALLCLWLFGAFLLAILLLSATLVKNNYASLLLTGGSIVLLFILNLIPKAVPYNPISLVSSSMDLVSGTLESSALTSTLGITTLLTVVLVGFGIKIFKKKRL